MLNFEMPYFLIKYSKSSFRLFSIGLVDDEKSAIEFTNDWIISAGNLMKLIWSCWITILFIMSLLFKFIDKIFEMGDLENLKKNDLKEFITKRVNENSFKREICFRNNQTNSQLNVKIS